jgi:acetyltransferase-like isoleucine patch superfamily enzyme
LDGSRKENVEFKDNIMFFGRIYSSGNGKVSIGNNTSIRSGCILYCAKKILIGDNVIFSNDIVISDTNHHPINPNDRLKMINSGWSSKLWLWKYSNSKEIIIEDNVWIGQYSRILKGVKVGRNSIIASNSVVTKDIPPNCIAAGNPAKIVKNNIEKGPRVFND